MKKLFAFILSFLSISAIWAQNDMLSHVNPLIGTSKSAVKTAGIYGQGTETYAHTIPAVLVPNGMTFWTPQTRRTEQKCIAPYYYEDEKLQGFRTSHWIVGGCTQDYGSFTICPSNRLSVSLPESSFSHDKEISTPAYYSAFMTDYKVKAEMTGTSRAAIFRFTYENKNSQYIYITSNSDEGVGEVSVMQDVVWIRGENPIHRIYQGYGESAGYSGWLALQTNGFIEKFGCLDKHTVWLKVKTKGKPVMVRCGTSLTSFEGAKKNLQTEIPDWDFEAVRSKLENVWAEQLNKIKVSGCNDNGLLTSFYTSLYHASFLPHEINDVDGKYPKFGGNQAVMVKNGKEGNGTYYDDFSVWDTYRALHPLLNIIAPNKAGEMMQSLVDKYEQGEWMPIFPCWNSYTAAMIGDHCASLFADAYIKGIRNFDVKKAYEGVRRNAFESPSDKEYKDGKGRRALKSYLENGFVPMTDKVEEAFHKNEQVSRTLEYAYDDFCAAQLARAVGEAADYRALTARAGNYRNVIKPEFSSMKDKVEWITEGAPCHYMWYVPQDPQGLMKLLGGRDAYVSKLDSMFSQGYYWHGNEPCHQVAYMYNYAGEQWKTARAIRNIMNSEYMPNVGGLAGNDDAGQMSAWYVFSALGFYPVCPGTAEYAIGSPAFPKVEIMLENGRTFTVIAKNSSPENVYIQSATLDGKEIDSAFLCHDDIVAGKTLEFVMGNKPNKEWGRNGATPYYIYNVMDFGAKGDGVTDDAMAIQKAIDEASKQHGQVLFPAGYTFMSSPLELKSNIDFHLESNATLIANPDESVYRLSAFGENIGEGMLWLYANGAENLTISGFGTIDGNGVAFMGAELDDSYELKELPTLNRKQYKKMFGQDTDYYVHHKEFPFDPRPHLLTLFGCERIEIKNVTIQNGAYWTVHLVGCIDAAIHDMSLLNNLKIRNGDGIDLDHTQNVHIYNCFITSGDDCVCLKNRREYSEGYTKSFPFISPDGIVMKSQKCGNIHVENCHMTSRSCSIKIGSENMDEISNVVFANCIITASNRGLGIQNRDEGTVKDVLFYNIKQDCHLFSDVWWGKAEPIYVTSYPRAVGNHKDAGWRFPKGAKAGKCGEVSHIVFENVDCLSENGCFVGGDEEGKVNDIEFKNVNLNFKRFTDYPLGVYDRRPCLGEGFVKGKTHGVVVDNAAIRDYGINVNFDSSFPREQYGEKIFNSK